MTTPLDPDAAALVEENTALRAENERLRALLDEAEGIVRDYSPGNTVWIDAVARERRDQEGG